MFIHDLLIMVRAMVGASSEVVAKRTCKWNEIQALNTLLRPPFLLIAVAILVPMAPREPSAMNSRYVFFFR